MPSRRKKSPKRRRSITKSRKNRCESLSSKKVCGPRKSCSYPKVYKRIELVKLAQTSKDEDINKNNIRFMSKDELCSRLKLKLPSEVKKFRIIEGKSCGPDKSSYNPNVWTVKGIKEFALEKNLVEKRAFNYMNKLELCEFIGDLYRKDRLKRDKNDFLISVENKLVDDLEYRGTVMYVSVLIYNLLKRHKDLCFYITPYQSIKFYYGITYSCEDKSITIEPDLISRMKNCSKRFYVSLVRLTGKIGHANFFLYDKLLNVSYLFEPLGTFKRCPNEELVKYLKNIMKIYFQASLIEPSSICPKIGIQKIASNAYNKAGMRHSDDSGGLCAAWNIFVLDMKMTYPDMDMKDLIQSIIDYLNKEELGAQNYLRRYLDTFLGEKNRLLEASKNAHIRFSKYMRQLLFEMVE